MTRLQLNGVNDHKPTPFHVQLAPMDALVCVFRSQTTWLNTESFLMSLNQTECTSSNRHVCVHCQSYMALALRDVTDRTSILLFVAWKVCILPSKATLFQNSIAFGRRCQRLCSAKENLCIRQKIHSSKYILITKPSLMYSNTLYLDYS